LQTENEAKGKASQQLLRRKELFESQKKSEVLALEKYKLQQESKASHK